VSDAHSLFDLDPVTRRVMLRRMVAMGMAVPAAQLLAACGGDDDGEPQASDAIANEEISRIGFAVNEAIHSLDIARSFTNPTIETAILAAETLLVVNGNYELEPHLASLEQPDTTTLVFTLKDGIEFSDGSPLTPEDVVWSWERHRDEKLASQVSYYLVAMKSVEATGPREVTISLSEPDPTFPFVTIFVQVLSRKQGEQAGDKLGSPTGVLIGTGMYTLTDFKPSAGATAIRNERYWGKKPRIKRIDIRVIPDPETLRLAAQSGEIAGSFDIPIDQLRRWKGAVTSQTAPGLTSTFISLPVTEEPFDDIRVRRAFAHALDREAIAKGVFAGAGEAAVSQPSRAHWHGLFGKERGDDVLASLPVYEFDLEKAKEELAGSKAADGFNARMQVNSSLPEHAKIALSLRQNLEQIGVTLEVTEITSEQYNERLFTDHEPLPWILTFYPVAPDPIDYFGITLPKDGLASGGYNVSGYTTDEMEKLLADQRGATGAEREEMIIRIAEIAARDLPYLPVVWSDVTVGLSADYGFEDFDAYASSRPWPVLLGRRA
jgi:peptide/nickel transport system substrate-binding protein